MAKVELEGKFCEVGGCLARKGSKIVLSIAWIHRRFIAARYSTFALGNSGRGLDTLLPPYYGRVIGDEEDRCGIGLGGLGLRDAFPRLLHGTGLLDAQGKGPDRPRAAQLRLH